MGKASRTRREKIADFLEHQDRVRAEKCSRLYDRLLAYSEESRGTEDFEDYTHIAGSVVIVVDDIAEHAFGLINQACWSEGAPFESDPEGFIKQWINEAHNVRLPFDKIFMEHACDDDIQGIVGLFIERSDLIGVNGHYLQFISDWRYRPEFCFWTTSEGTIKHIKEGPRSFGITDWTEPFVALYTLAFLNCRNVEIVDAPPPDPDTARKYERHFGQPMTQYKNLHIKFPRKQYDSEREGESQKRDLPRHAVRGHFRDNGDHPIPQFAGVHWISPHVRGDEKHGVLVKDYKVDAPQDG